MWDLADRYVGTPERPVVAHADLLRNCILKKGLQIKACPDPHSRHAIFVGWDADNKAERNQLATELADEAILTTKD